jgi:hypothetical protein
LTLPPEEPREPEDEPRDGELPLRETEPLEGLLALEDDEPTLAELRPDDELPERMEELPGVPRIADGRE